jgi:hypothetical protein
MSASPFASTSEESRTRSGSKFLLAGPKFPIMFLTALPAAVVALASVGHAQQVSGLIALGWFSLVPIALYERWVALALPVVAAGFLVLTLIALPFNSAAFVVDIWTSAAMFVLALPRTPVGAPASAADPSRHSVDSSD